MTNARRRTRTLQVWFPATPQMGKPAERHGLAAVVTPWHGRGNDLRVPSWWTAKRNGREYSMIHVFISSWSHPTEIAAVVDVYQEHQLFVAHRWFTISSKRHLSGIVGQSDDAETLHQQLQDLGYQRTCVDCNPFHPTLEHATGRSA